jgi:small GTP-binding protein
MPVIKKIQQLQQLLNQSPIISLQKPLLNNETLIKQLQSFRNETEILLEKCYNPLKIVLMGEVKAGKSTLLNAFAGEKVSPTNVTETTASIIEIKHAKQPKGSIHYKDGDNFIGTTEEVYGLLGENHGNLDFFANVSVVKLEFPLPSLQKVHLVDTPGLATVTSANEQTTIDYIQNSDVVLWVFSAHHLGQSDIEEQLENVHSYGKPVIAVINRLDESSATADELEDYIEDNLGFYVEEQFAISAYQAFAGIQTNDEELVGNSRFPNLLLYLEENIEQQNKEVQMDSIASSIKALAEKEKIQHRIAGEHISFLLQSMTRRKEEISYHNENIKKKMKMEMKNWIATEFLDEEKRDLIREIDGIGIMSGKNAYDSISSRVNKYVSSEYILDKLERKFSDINTKFQQEWDAAIRSIGEKISIEEAEFKQNQRKLYENTDISIGIYLPEGENALTDGAKKGAVIGGAYGFAAAAYTAVLGPSAAVVTMGSALAAVMPPVLIIGAVTGIAAKLVLGNKKKQQFSSEVINAINETKKQVSDVFLPKMIDQLEEQSNQIATDLYDKLCTFMSQGWNEKELQDIQHKLTSYQTNLLQWEQEMKDVELVL